MTSIEWLKERLKYRFLNNDTEESIFEKAKEMHKLEIIDAHIEGQRVSSGLFERTADQYYDTNFNPQNS